MNPAFLREAIRLSVEKMEAGAGGPFGAVVVRDGVTADELFTLFRQADPYRTLTRSLFAETDRKYKLIMVGDALMEGIQAAVERLVARSHRALDAGPVVRVVRRLRKTLEPFGKENLVQTVRGAGYRFSAIA